MRKKKMRGRKEKEDSNIERKKKAFGTLSSPNVFTYFASNLYPVIFQKGLDMANQAITNLQTNLRHPSHPMNESFSPSTSPAGIRQCALRTTPLASPDLCQEVGPCAQGSCSHTCPTAIWSTSEGMLSRCCWAPARCVQYFH